MSDKTDLRNALAAIARVRDLHLGMKAFLGDTDFTIKGCLHCRTGEGKWFLWPCPTIRALDDPAPELLPGTLDELGKLGIRKGA